MKGEMFGTATWPVKEVVCETIEEFNEQITKISEHYNVDSVDPGTTKFDAISKVVIYNTSKTPKWIMLCTAGDSTLSIGAFTLQLYDYRLSYFHTYI